MKRVAIFGNAGGGKSTLARELAAITGLPLIALTTILRELGYTDEAVADLVTSGATTVGPDH